MNQPLTLAQFVDSLHEAMREQTSLKKLRELLHEAHTEIRTTPFRQKTDEYTQVRLRHLDTYIAHGTRLVEVVKSINNALKEYRSKKLPLQDAEANSLRELRTTMREIVDDLDLLCLVSCGQIDGSWAALRTWNRLTDLLEARIKELIEIR